VKDRYLVVEIGSARRVMEPVDYDRRADIRITDSGSVFIAPGSGHQTSVSTVRLAAVGLINPIVAANVIIPRGCGVSVTVPAGASRVQILALRQ